MPRLEMPRLVMGTRIAVASELSQLCEYVHTYIILIKHLKFDILIDRFDRI